MVVTELYEILLNSMPTRWSKQACVQGFDYETIYFKTAVNMFECMEISEDIYGCMVTTSYKTTREESNRTVLIRHTRGEAVL